jgi:hypothetical protein
MELINRNYTFIIVVKLHSCRIVIFWLERITETDDWAIKALMKEYY